MPHNMDRKHWPTRKVNLNREGRGGQEGRGQEWTTDK
jgi:hypothetical protein